MSYTFSRKGVSAVWDPEGRIAVVRTDAGTALDAREAKFLVRTLTDCIGVPPAPFGLLVDGWHLRGTPAGRAVLLPFFRAHAGVLSVATVRFGPVASAVVRLHALLVGRRVREFAQEDEARAWLHAQNRVLPHH